MCGGAGRGGSGLSDVTFQSKLHLYEGFLVPLEQIGLRRVFPGMHLVVQTSSLFMSLRLSPWPAAALKASKERGPCSVFETGWHRSPRL